MNDDDRIKEALFRHAVLGDILSRKLRWGELRPLLTELSEKTFEDHHGRPRRMAPGHSRRCPGATARRLWQPVRAAG